MGLRIMIAKNSGFGKLDKKKLEKAIESSYSRLSMSMLHYVEDCVGCMSCKVACPYWYVDHRYSPVNKAEELRYIYRKTTTLSGKLLGKLAKAKFPETEEDIERMVEFAYKCSECGMCYISCPFGIDSGEMINVLRMILTNLGTTPTNLKVLSEIEVKGLQAKLPETMRIWGEALQKARAKIGKELPLDKEADIIVMPSLFDAFITPDAIANTAYILEKAGVNWSMPSKPMLMKPFTAWLLGDLSSAALIGKRLVEYVKAYKGKTLITIDGGIYYYFMRWVYPEVANELLPFEVKHIIELVYELYKQNKLAFNKIDDKITWHNPCKLGRKGGVIKEPKTILKAIAPNYKDLPHHDSENICCGGGGGMALQTQECTRKLEKLTGMKIKEMISEKEKKYLYRQEKVYYLALERKAKDIDKIKPDIVVTACPTCVLSLNHASLLYGPSYKVVHFVDIVAKALE